MLFGERFQQMDHATSTNPVLWRVDERSVAYVTLNRPQVWSLADTSECPSDVSFTSQSGHSAARATCPLRAISGLKIQIVQLLPPPHWQHASLNLRARGRYGFATHTACWHRRPVF